MWHHRGSVTVAARPCNLMSLQLPDLSQCADEPIRVPGAIQPHGRMLVQDAVRGHLVAWSSNWPDRQSAAGALSDLSFDTGGLPDGEPPAWLGQVTVENVAFDVAAHRCGALMLFEYEAATGDLGAQAPIYSLARSILPGLQKTATVLQLLEFAVRHIRELSGFARCLAYRFDSAGHGEVLAESGAEGYESWLGHRFPASDIPAQARDLYLLNQIRVIPDAAYRPADLVCEDPAWQTGRIDLSQAGLRSVSPVHLEYMRNMGTMASMSVSIVVRGRLWGLISTHNREPLNLPLQTRIACEHLGRLISLLIEAREDNAEVTERLRRRKAAFGIAARVAETDITLQGMVNEPSALLDLVHAQGLAIVHNDSCWSAGLTPGTAEVMALAQWFSEWGAQSYHSAQLADDFPQAAVYRHAAAGVLMTSISQVDRHMILWFRPEVKETVRWAGDPRGDPPGDDGRIHPRRSFATWVEQVYGHSLRWSDSDLSAVADLRQALIGIVLSRAQEAAKSAAELGRVNQELEKVITQLKSFAYSLAHDLRQPLITAGGFGQLLRKRLAATGDTDGLHYLDRLQAATRHVDATTDTLLELARISRVGLRLKLVDLSAMAHEAAVRLARRGPARAVDLSIEPGMTATADIELMDMVIGHLMGNAWKFTAHEPLAEIAMGTEQDEQGHTCWWIRDNGIGFDAAYATKVFTPFQRLFPDSGFEGLGAGLSIVEAAIQRHGGRVWAEAAPGKGATFKFTLGTIAAAGLPYR